MLQAPELLEDAPVDLPLMPEWLADKSPQDIETAGFLSGAALACLHPVLGSAQVPQAVLRDRLALLAAQQAMSVLGRLEKQAQLRDVIHLLRPGDAPGPAGEIALAWRRAVARPVSLRTVQRALPQRAPEQIAGWLGAATGPAVAQAASILETLWEDDPRAGPETVILADAALATALCWRHIVPVLAPSLAPRDLRKRGEPLRLACHRAIVRSVIDALHMARDLARRHARLQAIRPELRAKAAPEAIAMFLAGDALAPSALGGLMSDRSARRFCDRLVALGGARELTGRDTFRLYGL